jgi:hypothetical protein
MMYASRNNPHDNMFLAPLKSLRNGMPHQLFISCLSGQWYQRATNVISHTNALLISLAYISCLSTPLSPLSSPLLQSQDLLHE